MSPEANMIQIKAEEINSSVDDRAKQRMIDNLSRENTELKEHIKYLKDR